jgi:hypothetical protein
VNLQSEIDYFSDLQPVDQARLLAVFLHELASRRAAPTARAPSRCTMGRGCGS